MIPDNLPSQSHPFLGRKQELAEIVERLSDPNCRLLTVVGPGGIGKTRLAIEASSHILGSKTSHRFAFQDGIYFVPLQALISSDFNLSTLADSLNLQFSPDSNPQDQLLGYLRPKSTLLVFDNFEHLLDGAGLISHLLAAAPRLKVLATSREALNLQEEWLYRLDGMHYPLNITQETSEEYDAVQFFAAHARRIYPSFSLDHEREDVTRICRLVQGMPLALELASGWVRSLSVSEIADEIEEGLDILETRTSNIPARHRNMRAALDSSWNRLNAEEQAVFKKLSVFRGGFTREASETIANATRHALAGLVDKSWLQRNSAGRYDIHELLRQYGEERLNQANEAQQTHDRHCSYYANFLTQQWDILKGAKQKEALSQIETELENIRSHWEWAIHHMRESAIAPVLNTLWHFYDQGSRYQEGEQTFAKAVALANTGTHWLLRGQLLARQGALRHSLERPAEAKALLQESLLTLNRFDVPIDRAFCLTELGRLTLQFDENHLQARKYFQESHDLYETIGDSWGMGENMLWIGLSYEYEGNLNQAWDAYQQALAIQMDKGNMWGIGEITSQLSRIAHQQKFFRKAHDFAQQSLDCFQEMDVVWGMAMAYRYLGSAAYGLQQYVEAQHHFLKALTLEAEHHLYRHSLDTLTAIARIWSDQGQVEKAVELLILDNGSEVKTSLGGRLELLGELETQLSPKIFAEILERGTSRDFDTAIQEVMTELRQPEKTPIMTLPNLLTTREIEVLRLVAEGCSNREIAAQLVLAIGTVKWYLSEIFGKLDVSSRTQAIVRAHELKLITNQV